MFIFLNCEAGEKIFMILCIFQMLTRPPGINNCQAILFPMNTGTVSKTIRDFVIHSGSSRNLMKDRNLGLFSLFL